MKKETALFVTLAAGVGAFILIKKKGLFTKTATTTATQTQQQTQVAQTTQTTPAAATPAVQLNVNLVLKKGSQGPEVVQLQKLLGISADGIFGSQTETALVSKKGVTQITLAGFNSAPSVNANALKVGDRVMSIVKAGTKVNEVGTMADGTMYDTGHLYTTVDYGKEIGKIVALSSSKNYYVVELPGLFSGKGWVTAADVKKI